MCFTLLCFADSFIYLFYKLEVCGNRASSKSVGTIFPIAFAHFVSLYYIFIIFTILQTSSSSLYLLQWFVISDLWCYYYNFGRHPELHPYQMANLIDKCYVLTAPPTGHYFVSFSLGCPIPWDTTILKLGQPITLKWPLSVQVKDRAAHPLF